MSDEHQTPSDALQFWLKKKSITAYQLAKSTGLPQSRISEVLSGKRRITAETATHFGKTFDTSPAYWLSIQAKHDLNESRKDGAERQISSGELRLGSWICYAYVLSGERRVISANNFFGFFGIKPGAYASASKVASILDSPHLKSSDIIDLRKRVSTPLKFINQHGLVTYGYEGTTIVEFCKALLYLRRTKALSTAGLNYAEQAEAIIISLAKTGIDALIDEATGYQARRNHDALQRLFDVYLLKEYAAWAKRFPDEFYLEMFRLKGWKWDCVGSQKPPVVGTVTNDVVYQRLAPGVLTELKRLNPVLETGRRKVKHHQWLTTDIGHPALNQHLYAVCAMMRGNPDWRSFYHMLQITFPKQNEGVQLEFTDVRKPHDECS